MNADDGGAPERGAAADDAHSGDATEVTDDVDGRAGGAAEVADGDADGDAAEVADDADGDAGDVAEVAADDADGLVGDAAEVTAGGRAGDAAGVAADDADGLVGDAAEVTAGGRAGGAAGVAADDADVDAGEVTADDAERQAGDAVTDDGHRADGGTTAPDGGSAAVSTRRRFPWWHERTMAFRRTVRTTAVVLVAFVVSAGFGVLSAQFTGSLGPHVAQYSTTLNSEITVDMGPLGALIIDSPLPLGLGADVVVQEIPDELAADGDTPVAGLTADLTSYSQFLANPEAAIRDAANGLIRDAVGRTVLAWSVLLCLIALGRLASHGVLRQAARGAWRQQGVPALVVGLVLAVAVPTAVHVTRGSEGVGRTSQVLAGTPLADARITGRLGQLVDFYGGYVVDAITDNEEFYAEVEANLRAAYATDPEPLAPAAVPPMVPTIDPAQASEEPSEATTDPTEPTTDPTEPTTDPTEPTSTDDEDAPSSADAADDAVEPDPITIAMVTDLHCNVGMAPVLGAVVELSGAELVLNAGDTVMGGTSVESVCVNAFADGIGNGVPVVVADGNHDSETTASQESARGWTVLRGEPVEVAGVTILGDRDPMLTSLGAPTHPQRDETFEAMGDRLAQVACDAQEAGSPIDILLVHNPNAAQASLFLGCVPLALDGHLHRRIGPWQRGLGIQYLSASTAGATKDTPTIGPLQNPATMTLIRWDRANDEAMDFRVITFDVDRSVTIGPWQSFPPLPTEPVDLDTPPAGEGPWDVATGAVADGDEG